jgi:hypothetical protein
MSKTKPFILLLIISSIFSFCKKENIDNDEKTVTKITPLSEITANFKFPDTVKLNKYYNGEIVYKSILDTLTTNVLEEINGIDRYVIFSLITTKHSNYSINELRKMKLDTFGAVDNNLIPFYKIKFTELGTNYIYGILNDHAIIDTLRKPIKESDKVRFIENEIRLIHKVIVIK